MLSTLAPTWAASLALCCDPIRVALLRRIRAANLASSLCSFSADMPALFRTSFALMMVKIGGGQENRLMQQIVGTFCLVLNPNQNA